MAATPGLASPWLGDVGGKRNPTAVSGNRHTTTSSTTSAVLLL